METMENKEILEEKIRDVERGFQPYRQQESGYARTVLEAMNYSFCAGGKRLRPLFMRETYQMFGGSDEGAVRPFMMAIEMIHTYSLVHDDLPAMDDDDYRRGKPTTHIKYGEDIAILTGDALLNGAFETAFLAFDSGTDSRRVGQALKILGRKAGIHGMVGGQAVDVENNGYFVDHDMLSFVYKNKTAALIEASLMIGAVLAGADQEAIDILENIGTDIGFAFQIQDDILDVEGDEKTIGKPVNSDAKNDKSTYVAIHGIEESGKKVREYTERGLAALSALRDKYQLDIDFLSWLFTSLVGREK